MKIIRTFLIASVMMQFISVANAQDFTIPWHTIDGGGGESTGGIFDLAGTIGQLDAGTPMTGGDFTLTGGFWSAGTEESCYADFNNDGQVNTLDFLAYLNAFTDGDMAADCNQDAQINTLDFLCFLNAFTEGCP